MDEIKIPGREIRQKPVDNFKQLLEQSKNLFNSRQAFVIKESDGKYIYKSFNDFYDDVNALGTALLDLKLKDPFIAVMGENRYEWCLSYLAIGCGAGVIVPIDRELPPDEICNLLNRSRANVIIYSGKLEDKMEAVRSGAEYAEQFICMDGSGEFTVNGLIEKGKKLIENGDRQYLNAVIDSNALGVLLFTSGTTGVSKGVMLSQKNICFDIESVSRRLDFTCEDTIMSILPLHHTYECTCGFLTMFYGGTRISFCEGIRHISQNILEYKPSILMLVPLILENVYKKIMKKANTNAFKSLVFKILLGVSGICYKMKIDIRAKLFKSVMESLGGNLRLVISGAAGMDPKISSNLIKMGVNIRQGYGLTECSPILTVNGDDEYISASIGPAMDGIELRIDTPNEEGIGEILAKGPNVMLGYFEDPVSTSLAIKDGWFRTGDLGYIDKKGFAYITGRKKNIIVTKTGKNIYPEELESYLTKIPYVLESLVYGIESPDGDTVTHAVVVPNIEQLAEAGLNTENIEEIHKIIWNEIKKLNKTIPSYKAIKSMDIRMEEFEKTTTQKIKRYRSKQIVAC